MKYLMRCTLRLGCEQEGAIECVAEFDSRRNIAPEVSDSDNVRSGDPILEEVPTGNQGNVYDAVQISKAGSAIKENIGGEGAVCNGEFWQRDLLGLVGFIDHDGVSRYWNSTKEC